MSQAYSLICPETRKKVWVGQGYGKMDSFYRGEPLTMRKLGAFLRDHEGKALMLVSDSFEPADDYDEYGYEEAGTFATGVKLEGG